MMSRVKRAARVLATAAVVAPTVAVVLIIAVLEVALDELRGRA